MVVRPTKQCIGLTLMLAFAVGACKSKRSTLEGLSASFASSSDGTLPLKQQESQVLYELMRNKEAAMGLKLLEGSLHNTQGLLECGKERVGALPPCYLRLQRANSHELSQNLPMPPDLAKTVWGFLRSAPQLSNEPVVIADLQCNYLGKATPPYEVEATTCKILYPRLPNETIISGKIAEEIANKLQGDIPYSGTLASPTGTVLCYWSEKDSASECLLRRIKDGVLQESFLPASTDSASFLFKALQKSALYSFETSLPKGAQPQFVAPLEFMSSVSCLLDLARLKTTNQSYAHCKLTI